MLLVIGLDGASYDLCERWMAEGYLPNLAHIKRAGLWAPLRSTIPSTSPVAWSTFMTGKNPGEHGVFGFFVPERREPHLPPTRFRPVSSHDCHGKRFWEQMNEAGLSTGIVGVPVTYPVSPVRGHIIAGLLAPGLHSSGVVSPSGLAAEIKEHVGAYRMVPRGIYTPGAEGRFLRELHTALELRGRLASYLLDQHRCDVHMFVFYETDAVQHKMWQFMDPEHPRYTEQGAQRWGCAIRAVYMQADAIIGELYERLGPDDTLVVLSDHGAGPLRGTLHLNKWLREQGYLVLKPGLGQRVKRVAAEHKAVQLCTRLSRLIGATRWIKLAPAVRRMLASGFLSAADIDWSATRAYSLGFEGAIYVTGRRREETIGEIAVRLAGLRDPATGEIVVEAAQQGRELYEGPFAAWAPDIVLRPRGGLYSASQKAFATELVGLGIDSGAHQPKGIFGLVGAQLPAAARTDRPALEDVAPLLLSMAGLTQ